MAELFIGKLSSLPLAKTPSSSFWLIGNKAAHHKKLALFSAQITRLINEDIHIA